MPLSYEVLPGNGVDNQFNVSINYLDQSHIAVYIDGVEDTGFTWVNATRLQTSTTPANGANVKISRTTPREKANRLVDWEGNGVITEANLDSSDLQVLYIAQEAFDQLGDVLGVGNDAINWDAESKKILNLANGTDSQDACTYGQLLSATSGGGASITIPNPTAPDVGKLLTAIVGGYQLTTAALGALSSEDTVSTSLIDNDAVTSDKILDDAVIRDKIADGAVNGDKIASDTVTLAKLAHNSSNDELIGYNSGNPANIAIGSGLSLSGGTLSNTLTSSSDYEYITTKIASASATLDFTSELTWANYRQVRIDYDFVVPTTDGAQFQILTTTDGGTSFDSGASDYEWSLRENGSSYADTADDSLILSGLGVGNASNECISGTIILRQPNNTTDYKSIRLENMYLTDGGIFRLSEGVGRRKSITNIDGVRFSFTSGNITSGTFSIYGVK